MSRTRRKKSTKVSFMQGDKHLLDKDHVRDGTYTRYSPSCENHGGCAHCENNRLHGNKRRQELYSDSSEEDVVQGTDLEYGDPWSEDDWYSAYMEGE